MATRQFAWLPGLAGELMNPSEGSIHRQPTTGQTTACDFEELLEVGLSTQAIEIQCE